MVYAAKRAGATKILKAGGAQAIAQTRAAGFWGSQASLGAYWVAAKEVKFSHQNYVGL